MENKLKLPFRTYSKTARFFDKSPQWVSYRINRANDPDVINKAKEIAIEIVNEQKKNQAAKEELISINIT